MSRVERYFEITIRFFKGKNGFVRIAAGFVVLLFLLCSGSTAPAAGFPEAISSAIYGTASTIGEAVKGAVDHMLFRFVLKRSYDNFIVLRDLTAAYFAETDDLIRSMHRPAGRVGAVSFERMSGELTVDQRGGVRLLYGGDDNGTVADAVIDLSGFKEYVEAYLLLSARPPANGSGLFRGRISRGSVGLILYDRHKLTSATLFGSPDIVGTIPPPKHVSDRPSAGFGTRGLLWSAPMDRAGGDIILVALYPYRLQSAVYTFGLIAIIILTILLLWLIITYTTAYYRTRGVQPMPEKDKRPDIINEIDKELTDGENKKHPEETGAGKDTATGEDPGKHLEEDGIFIGK